MIHLTVTHLLCDHEFTPLEDPPPGAYRVTETRAVLSAVHNGEQDLVFLYAVVVL